MKISIIIPCHNEQGHIKDTILNIKKVFLQEKINDFEILVINDNSSDKTQEIVEALNKQDERISIIKNKNKNGYGFAVICGLNNFKGDAVIISMADGSDDPLDMVKYYKELLNGYDCVFGTRFCKQAKVIDYPFFKLILNRIGNWLIKLLFKIKYNDVSNGFKAYKREVIKGLYPIFSYHFNLTVELPLKAIVRGFSYKIVPTNWYNRKDGVSKWKIKEMGSRYLFIILYVFLEKHLSCGDYYKAEKTIKN